MLWESNVYCLGIGMGFFSHLFGSKRPQGIAAEAVEGAITAPASGQVVELAEIADPAFAGGMLGEGVGIVPESGEVFSPIAGTVAADVDSGHALLLRRPDGVEVLVHAGLDTVRLKGRGFTTFVRKGDKVNAGDCVIAFDLGLIEEAKLDPTVVVTVSETLGAQVERLCGASVKAGEPLLKVVA